MMSPLQVALLSALSLTWQCGHAMEMGSPPVNHGLVGFGIRMYDPVCAFACHDSLSSAPLNCSAPDPSMNGMLMSSADCYATDDAFLQSAAYCIKTYCHDVPLWKIEKYWSTSLVGNDAEQPAPKVSYQQALLAITTAPERTASSEDALNETVAVKFEDWSLNGQTLAQFERTEVAHERYGIALAVSCLLGPIFLSMLRFAPVPKGVVSKVNSYLISPALFGNVHSRTPRNLGVVPTRGQTLFIGYIILINIVLSVVNNYTPDDNAWWDSSESAWKSFFSDRMGVLSFVNMAISMLYAGRNNILLLLTDWSHSTFLLLHRWLAYVSITQAILHSILWLELAVDHEKTYAEDHKTLWWIWGSVATVALSVMIPFSLLAVRRRFYEIFLVSHVVLVIVVLVGLWFHIWYLYQHQWGYENWLYAAFAVWGYDRLVRLLKIGSNGICRAVISEIDEDYLRIDIPGVASNGHVYLYFPTLTWRVWENHPFSVASTASPKLPISGSDSFKSDSTSRSSDIEKSPATYDVQATENQLGRATTPFTASSVNTTLFIRSSGGLTAKLRKCQDIPVLVEGRYGHTHDLSSFSNLICVAGGVGITAILPFLRQHSGNAKLYWGMRNRNLLDAVQDTLAPLQRSGLAIELAIGERFDLEAVLERDVAAALDSRQNGDVITVVSGPPGMADDVRAIVSRISQQRGGRRGRVEFLEESFTW